jgi:hypothetical protein
MRVWHGLVLEKLRESGLFTEVALVGAKVRASTSEALFLDIHYDPTTGSYSYALVDPTSPFPGDKRILGWNDYPHEGVESIQRLSSYPHHFQRRSPSGEWLFEESEMRGDIERDMGLVLDTLRRHLGL